VNSSFFVQPTALNKASPGIVYVLINEAMPGLVKIGMTTGDLSVRMKQLDTTGVPLPFECVHAVQVADVDFVEDRIHRAFHDRRLRNSREFFRMSPEPVKAILELVAGMDVTPKEDVVESPDDQAALDAAKQRRSRFDFAMVGIKPGETLTSAFNEDVTCTVHDQRHVLFRGQIRSLSDAALEVAHEKGFLWKAVQGPRAWKHAGSLLDDLRNDAMGAGGGSHAETD
jgi:T5orf172 domain